MASIKLADITAHAKSYGFVFPSSTIYDGLQAVYDYGPYGIALKKRVQEFWWRSMVQLHDNIVGLDAAILMHPKTWEASGHVAGFYDWLVDHKVSKKRYRVDLLLENQVDHLRACGKEQQANQLQTALQAALADGQADKLKQLLVDYEVVCPIAQTGDWSPVRRFNLMFSTQLGAVAGDAQQVFLRPETAQGIFVNFLNILKTTRQKLPFGIAQVGKAFRNEIVARQFTFRMREFEQMEMQFFVPPEESPHFFSYWLEKRHQWHKALGISPLKLKLVPHQSLAHYATEAVDISYAFPFGQKEVEGVHARSDFDLKQHQAYARKKMTYFDPINKRHYLPHVIETSCGLDRLVLMLLCNSYRHTSADNTPRTHLALPAPLAPTALAILPLTKKDGLAACAQKIHQTTRLQLATAYDDAGSIGKRYTRQDLIGTPFCLTVDHQTLVDETVTLRQRDDRTQKRYHLKEALDYVTKQVDLATLLRLL